MFAVAGLLSPPARITTGTVRFRGDDLVTLTERELDALRWRDFSVVLQSAMNALNPVATLAAQYKDAMAAHARLPRTRSGPLHRGPRTRSASTPSTCAATRTSCPAACANAP
ncbi:hypothetical protein [Streptomyces sp. KL116D]|uniref:hypothetical protein n=1 Tax=Streptomyces sp. KL116D TaxID=3045152 RepID=UPI003558ECE4